MLKLTLLKIFSEKMKFEKFPPWGTFRRQFSKYNIKHFDFRFWPLEGIRQYSRWDNWSTTKSEISRNLLALLKELGSTPVGTTGLLLVYIYNLVMCGCLFVGVCVCVPFYQKNGKTFWDDFCSRS